MGSYQQKPHQTKRPLISVILHLPNYQEANMPGEIVIKNSKTVMQVCKLSEHAFMPTKGSKLAAGYDLKSAYDYIIPANGKVIAKTDLAIRVPDGTYGRVAPRSGLAAKNHIDIGAGVVDQDYTGNVESLCSTMLEKTLKSRREIELLNSSVKKLN